MQSVVEFCRGYACREGLTAQHATVAHGADTRGDATAMVGTGRMSLLNMCTSRVGDPNPAARE